MELWIPIIATVVLALIGIIYARMNSRADKQEQALKEAIEKQEQALAKHAAHLDSDASTKERIVRLEERQSRMDRDIGDHTIPGSIVHRLHEYSKSIRNLFGRITPTKREDQ